MSDPAYYKRAIESFYSQTDGHHSFSNDSPQYTPGGRLITSVPVKETCHTTNVIIQHNIIVQSNNYHYYPTNNPSIVVSSRDPRIAYHIHPQIQNRPWF